MAAFAARTVTARSGSVLLPLALVACIAAATISAVFSSPGLVFQVPLAGSVARQPQLQRAQQLGLQPQLLAGLPATKVPPSRRVAGVEGVQPEASVALIVAATALAALSATGESAPEAKDEETGLKATVLKTFDSVKLPIFVCLWYFFNVQYNIQNKKLLSCFSATWAVSWIQLAAGIPIAALMWMTGFVQLPKVTKSDLLKLAPVGAAFAAGQVATVASLGAVAVSFTHVVKALEPAVNAIASALVLGQVFHPMVYASLAPVFLGVALASSSELSFTMFGFLTAMASNFAFVTRNVLATKFGSVGDMGEDKTTRKTNQLAVLTAVATLVLLPVAMVLPGGLFSIPAAWSGAIKQGVSAGALTYMMVASGFHFFMYQLSSFWVLSCVQPITHSVLNTLKRVVIIVVSIFVFRNPVTPQSALGTGTAIGGVLLYSLTKSYYSKKK
mmetsp:Transcript_3625/g.10923  ORF Transcript_3625/g.10923 Transcript_3625/m.10923 type:complete len:444 (+) Transcript_3625:85-1416(+)